MLLRFADVASIDVRTRSELPSRSTWKARRARPPLNLGKIRCEAARRKGFRAAPTSRIRMGKSF
jgi:hypothetical protein